MPLFAGYAIQNRVKETVALEEKARNDLEAARRTVAKATRAAYFGLQSGLAQVNALQAAEASSQSALDANKLGYQVGVRINIDVLNSQSQLFDTKAKLAKARYDVLLGGLKCAKPTARSRRMICRRSIASWRLNHHSAAPAPPAQCAARHPGGPGPRNVQPGGRCARRTPTAPLPALGLPLGASLLRQRLHRPLRPALPLAQS